MQNTIISNIWISDWRAFTILISSKASIQSRMNFWLKLLNWRSARSKILRNSNKDLEILLLDANEINELLYSENCIHSIQNLFASQAMRRDFKMLIKRNKKNLQSMGNASEFYSFDRFTAVSNTSNLRIIARAINSMTNHFLSYKIDQLESACKTTDKNSFYLMRSIWEKRSFRYNVVGCSFLLFWKNLWRLPIIIDSITMGAHILFLEFRIQ